MKKTLTMTLLLCLTLSAQVQAATQTQSKKPKKTAYLMVYHKDVDHSLHMAISHDGYVFTALNNDRPIFAGDTIAQQHGIRDPHIFRSPDGLFCIAMTDLHLFGQRAGYRTTQWDRDGEAYGWGNNRGLVLMSSRDLVHWKRTNLDISACDPSMADIGCAWAPETVFDDETGQLMIHFTSRHGNGHNLLYYAYINNDYDRLLTVPHVLLAAPDDRYNIIDGDIVKVGDKYHLFYVSHESGAYICRATSDHISGPFTANPEKVSHTQGAHEAPNVWYRVADDRWVLMYDIFSARPHTFGFETSTDLTTFTLFGRFNDEHMQMTNCTSPKHGSVIPITEKEARRLEKLWNK